MVNSVNIALHLDPQAREAEYVAQIGEYIARIVSLSNSPDDTEELLQELIRRVRTRELIDTSRQLLQVFGEVSPAGKDTSLIVSNFDRLRNRLASMKRSIALRLDLPIKDQMDADSKED